MVKIANRQLRIKDIRNLHAVWFFRFWYLLRARRPGAGHSAGEMTRPLRLLP
ncbi:MAG TPA: hypothetical protein PLA70_11385 [Tenuifilaceae bacterium]|nr:hypothetical protein [Tenuifilaceae bacterium]HPC70092.1 hypothetical protein [Tenuifilaceae bacterium]HPC70095.1 hypothetical protein [Tenuifilaceae bacterium]HQI64018.1 hypothetical protein [Bacteroidales bacterium]